MFIVKSHKWHLFGKMTLICQQSHVTQYEMLIFVMTPQFGCKGHKYPDNSERRWTEAHPHSGQWHWNQGKSLFYCTHQ